MRVSFFILLFFFSFFYINAQNNTCPVTYNDTYNFVKQTPLNVGAAQGVLSNDVDANNDNLISTLVSNSTRGDLSLNANGSFSYNACKNINLQGTFNAVTTNTGNWCPAGPGKVSQKQQFAWTQSGNNLYSVVGGDFTYGGYSACGYNQKPGGTLKVKYECGVLSPVGISQWGETYTFNSVETSADRSTLTIDWKNDYGESSISVLTDWAGGIWPILSHNDNYKDSFTYMANDGTCNSNVATVSLNVIDNDCPVGVNDVYQVNKGGVLNIISAADGVLINDTDAQNNILTAKVASPPLHGNLNLNSNGSFTYAHNGSDNTSDGFKYLANDGYCDSDTVIVTINVSYPTPTNGEWTQEGNDIIPPPKIDDINQTQPYASEVSISQNGSVVAAGYSAFDKDAVKLNIGLIKVFKNINNVWTQDGYIEGENTSDKFGNSISLSGDGNTLIGGSKNGLTKGFVRVYRKINNTWTKLGSDILGELDNDQFGAQVSISTNGNKIAVSAPSHDGGKGHVRVYNWNGTTWTKMGQDIDGEAANDRSGKWRQLEISGDGNSVAIGSTTNGGGKGHTRVYSWNGNAWTQLGQDIDGKSIEGAGRVSINNNGTIVAVGGYQNDGYTGNPNDNRGVVRIFEFKNNSWTQLGQDVHGNTPGDLFGNQLSINDSGDTLAIGIGWNDKNGSMSGQVKVITYNKNLSKWEQLGQDVYGLAKDHVYGYQLQISGDGSRFVTTKRINGDTLRIFKFNQANICPVSANDSYVVDKGSSVFFDGPQSVLSNDTDANNNNLKATHQSLPTNGTISCQNSSDPRNGQSNVICENGQFTYTHDGSNSSSDSFTYKANDGTCDSNLATVTIKINIPIDPTGSWFQIGQDIGEDIGSGLTLSSDGSTVVFSSIEFVNDQKLKVYKKINNVWTQMGNNLEGSSLSETSINGDGTRLAIGNWGYGLSGNQKTYIGSLKVFDYSNNAWKQVGQTIYGSSSGSRLGSGVSISLDGNILAVGAEGNNDKGSVYIYKLENNTWTQLGQVINGESNYDSFGSSVSLSNDGKRVVIGSEGNDANGDASGQVRVYQYVNNIWSKIGQDINGDHEDANLGVKVSISGDGSKFAVLAPSWNNDNKNGVIKVYEYNNNLWKKLGSDLYGFEFGDEPSTSFSLSDNGKILAFGVNKPEFIWQDCYNSNFEFGFNHRYSIVYQFQNNNWKQVGNIIKGDKPGDASGNFVSLSSDGSKLWTDSYLIALGEPNDTLKIKTTIRNYEILPNNCPNVSPETYNIKMGSSININASNGLLANVSDIDGNNLISSIRKYPKYGFVSCEDPVDPNNGKRGSICQNGSFKYSNDGIYNPSNDTIFYQVYDGGCKSNTYAIINFDDSPDTKSWTQLGQTLGGEADDDFFGIVSMNAEGDIMAVGSPYNSNLGGDDSGMIRVFKYDNNSWTQIGQDINGKNEDEEFGWHVSLSDDGYTLVASNGEFSSYEVVRVYKFENNTWVQVDNDIKSQNENCFGCVVDISGDGSRIAISEIYNDRIYLYKNDGNSVTPLDVLNINTDVGYDTKNMGMSQDGSRIAFFNNRSEIKVFDYSSNGSWSQAGNTIVFPPNEYIGNILEISGDGKSVVAQLYYRPDIIYCTSYFFTRVYKFVNNTWVQSGNDIYRDSDSYYALDINYYGDRIAIGDEENDNIKLFELKDNKWKQIGQSITAGDDDEWLSLNNDGSKLAVGIPEAEFGPNRPGIVKVYSYPSSPPPPSGPIFNFTTSSSSEVEGKSVDINVKIENPSPNSSTTVDVVLTSGDSKDIGDFSSKTLTFPEGNYNSANQKVSISITDDALEEGGEDVVFTLKNASGTATIGQTSTHTLTIIDNDGNVTGFENHESGKNINIFPNPTTGIINIRFHDTWNGNVHFKLFDAFGKQEAQNTIDNSSGNSEFQLDVSNRKDGVFFIELSQDDKKVIKKVIKK